MNGGDWGLSSDGMRSNSREECSKVHDFGLDGGCWHLRGSADFGRPSGFAGEGG
jgi:hypothetical protein